MIALHKLLCATDIERPARAALRLGFFIAEQVHASLSVVHAREPRHDSNLYLCRQRRFEQLSADQRLLERLDAVVRDIPSAATGRATTSIVDGRLAEAVVTFSERQKSDLIVLGASTHGPHTWQAAQTMAERIGHITMCPIMTVPHDNVTTAPRLRRMLLPVDRISHSSADAVAWAVLLASRFGALVEVLHTDERSEDPVEEALKIAGVAFETNRCSLDAGLADCILARVARGDCDLVVMPMRPRGPSHDGVLAKVRRRSETPVLSVRAKEAERRFVDDPTQDSPMAPFMGTDARAA